MTDARLLTDDLLFPEGPVPLADGSVLCVEIARHRSRSSRRTAPSGRSASPAGDRTGRPSAPTARSTSATTAAASSSSRSERCGCPARVPDTWHGGSIQRLDLDTGDSRHAVHGVRRPAAAGAERPRVRRRPAASGSPTTACARTGRATARRCTTHAPTAPRSSKSIFPLDAPNGVGPLAGRPHAVRRRDAHRSGLAMERPRARCDRRDEPVRPGRRRPAVRLARLPDCSTRWRSTATAGCASEPW